MTRRGWLYWLAVFAVLAMVWKTHYVAVILRFETLPQMIDSGWFAYLFGRVDPMLMNPAAISALSFHAYHLSPLIYLWALPAVGLLGLGGAQSLALFHFAAGALALAAFLAVGLRGGAVSGRGWAALGLGGGFVVTNLHMAQAIEFPHYEIMLVGLCAAMFAALLRGWFRAAVAAAALLVLLREDGGLYAAYVAQTFAACHGAIRARRIQALFVACLAASILAFWLQAAAYAKVPIFETNFAGDGFSHVTGGFLAERVWALVTSFRTGGLLLWAALAAVFARRHLGPAAIAAIWVPILLLAPLIALHLLAVRPTLGFFRVYYALPFAVIVALILLSLLHRLAASPAHRPALAWAAALIAVTSVFWAQLMSPHGQAERWARALAAWPSGQLAVYQAVLPAEDAPGFATTCLSQRAMALSVSAYRRAQVYPIRDPGPEDSRNLSPDCQRFFVFEIEQVDFAKVLRRQGFEKARQWHLLVEYRKIPGGAVPGR